MNKNSLGLIATIIALGVGTFFVLQRPGESSSAGDASQRLASYDSLAVDKIEITTGSNSIRMEKQAGKWMIVHPISYRADENAVTTAISKGVTTTLTSLISSNPQKQGLFQVDTTAGTLVRVFEKGTEKAAFRVGKPGSSFTETYVRVEGSNDVYLADELLTYVFAKQVKDWRDKTIFGTDQAKIRSVSFQFGDTTFALALQDTVWMIEGTAIAQSTVNSLLSALSNFVADDFVDSALTPPPLIGSLEVSGVQIRFHAESGTANYYVQTSQSAQWFNVQQWRVGQVLKRKKDLVGITS